MKKKEMAGATHSVWRDVLVIVLGALAVFVFICLVSYSPYDPSWTVAARSGSIDNLGGRIGSYSADLLITLLGPSAYLVCLALLFPAFATVAVRSVQLSARQGLGLLFFSLGIPVLGSLFWGAIDLWGKTVSFGGLWGQSVSHVLLRYFNRWGSVLCLSALLLVSLVLVTRSSIGVLSRRLVHFLLVVAGETARLLYHQGLLLSGRVNKWYRNFRKRREMPKPVLAPQVIASPMLASVTAVSEKRADTVTPALKIFKRKEEKRKDDSSQLDFLASAVAPGYTLPPLALLDQVRTEQKIEINEESLRANATLLESKLRDFDVEGNVSEIHPGPVITMYEFVPAPGVKINRIVNLADDLSLAMEGRQVRIVAPLPDKAAVGIEIPNRDRETVWLRDMLDHPKFKQEKSKLMLALGKDISGECYVSDLSKMPHLLVAGATGSGKSVCINTMIVSFLYQSTPEDVRMIMVDPKMLELSVYQGIPHLLLPVVTDPKKAARALRWAVREMERRYQLLADLNARNIVGYNKRIEREEHKGRNPIVFKGEELLHNGRLPYIVIVIDELADLMMVAGKEVEDCIARLAQMARAAGIHLILATQRPSVDVLTGVIKANFPARISFKISARHDSRTILDRIGAEQLLGSGDMLFLPPGSSRLLRIHGAYVTEHEIARVAEFLKKQGEPDYHEDEILKATEEEGLEGGLPQEELDDSLYDAAVAIVAETRQASISMVQRRLRIGYNRAARLIEKMETEGIVSPPNGAKGREVLVGEIR